jgi:glycosyltransferase involved in cell wall biosynthesis
VDTAGSNPAASVDVSTLLDDVEEVIGTGTDEIGLVGRSQRATRPHLSVIVPAYRTGERISANLDRLVEALACTALTWEIIVVVDGDPETYACAAPRGTDRIHVYGYDCNRGKGFALRFGISKARGELVTLIDADMEIGPEEIGRMAALLDLYRADIVVGSKRHPLSQVHYPAFRRLQSLCYQLLIRLLFRVRIRDTQTGLKVMRREVARRVLRVAVVKKFAFDLEVLVLASHFGFRRIIEAPVTIEYRFSSTTNPRAVFRVLWDTAAIFYRLYIRRWYDARPASGLRAMLSTLPSAITPETIRGHSGERTDRMNDASHSPQNGGRRPSPVR